MNKIKEISLPLISIVLLLSLGGFVTYKYLTLEGTVNQVVAFLNQQIANSQKQQQAPALNPNLKK